MKDKDDFTISQALFWYQSGLDKKVNFKSEDKCVIDLESPKDKSSQGQIYLQKVDEDAKQTVWQMTNLIIRVNGKLQFKHPDTLYYAKK